MKNTTSPRDMQLIRSFTASFLNNPARIPFSYKIGETRYEGIPAAFNPSVKKRLIDANIIEHTFAGTDPDTGLGITVECFEYLDYPVVEWTAYLTNNTDTPTPVVSELTGMDGALTGENPVVVHNNGDTCTYDLYTDTASALSDGPLEIETVSGRSSDGAAPYGHVLCDGMGYTWSVGWSGQWKARFTAVDGGFKLMAKQSYTAFRVLPGETMRAPRMSIMAFEGGQERGLNLWRRWLFDHVIPKPNGATIPPTRSLSYKLGNSEFEKATEENQIRGLRSLDASGIRPENLWIDAGWYDCRDENGNDSWARTGKLYHCPVRFPNGLKPVGDVCREMGINLLMWFEPERVTPSQIAGQYPESYLLWLKDKAEAEKTSHIGYSMHPEAAMFDLGNPEACDWLINHIDKLIKEYGISIYRQDCNYPVMPWWLQNDEPDRVGSHENLFVQGLLRFWDELLLRNPGLWINSVAAGGRRSDLEVLRRSVPLHQTDLGHGFHPLTQAVRAYSAAWQPYFGCFAMNWEEEDGSYTWDDYSKHANTPIFDNFMAHNAFGPSFGMFDLGAHCGALPDGEFAKTEEGMYYKKFTELWKRAAPLTLNTDFYVLHMTDRREYCWHAIQYHKEETGEGIIQVIRNSKAPDETLTVRPRGIDPSQTYLFESPEFSRTFTISGRDLIDHGLTVSLPPRTGELLFYQTVSGANRCRV